MYYDIIYSEDDGGYYCEIYNQQGKDLHTTELYPTQKQAEQAVLKFSKTAEFVRLIN